MINFTNATIFPQMPLRITYSGMKKSIKIPRSVTTLYDTACKLFHTAYILGIFRYGKRDFPFQHLRNDILLSRNSIIIVTYEKEVVKIYL